MDDIIRIDGLEKRFGEVHAVNNLSFRVKRGELFAFLGVNGAGKSTTISIMCGLLEKDGGNVEICGKNVGTDMREIAKKLGVVFQNSALDARLSVKDNLVSRAALYGIYGAEAKKRIDELAEKLCFKDLMTRTVGKLSGGQRRRIDVARALLHKPEVLILDEPTTGLHFEDINRLLKVLQTLVDQGNTVVVIEHNLDVIKVADYIVDLGPEGGDGGGTIVTEGTPEQVAQCEQSWTGKFLRDML